MNRIIAVCHSIGRDGLGGAHVFLRSLTQTFTKERFASIHILHGPTISRKDFPHDRYHNLKEAVYKFFGIVPN
jgi:hypothetical protein